MFNEKENFFPLNFLYLILENHKIMQIYAISSALYIVLYITEIQEIRLIIKFQA